MQETVYEDKDFIVLMLRAPYETIYSFYYQDVETFIGDIKGPLTYSQITSFCDMLAEMYEFGEASEKLRIINALRSI